MAKKNQCIKCVNYDSKHGPIGQCRAHGWNNWVAATNSACKTFLPFEKLTKKPVEFGDAPFCGDFPKCNNAEGCDYCAEFEKWAEENAKTM